jgi:hypothetical protein
MFGLPWNGKISPATLKVTSSTMVSPRFGCVTSGDHHGATVFNGGNVVHGEKPQQVANWKMAIEIIEVVDIPMKNGDFP